MNFQPFTDEQARVIVNLEQVYQVWMEALRTLNDLPYNNGFIRDAPDETLDFDMALTGLDANEERPALWKVLNEADMTYSVNTERPF